jgi:hypothetical protein
MTAGLQGGFQRFDLILDVEGKREPIGRPPSPPRPPLRRARSAISIRRTAALSRPKSRAQAHTEEVRSDGETVPTVDQGANRPPPRFKDVVHLRVQGADALMTSIAATATLRMLGLPNVYAMRP